MSISDRPKFTAYITRWALTRGILTVEVEQCTDIGTGSMVTWDEHGVAHGEGTQWHRTLEAAKAAAEKMRGRKIATLMKQIEALRKLRF